MIANYHTHTWRCNHAAGREADYVRIALDRGFQLLGFSDHTPYPFPDGYCSSFRMRPDQLGDYCDTVRLLQKKYAGQIQLPLGLEAEYYPAYFPELLSILRDAGIEYLLLGQHFVGNEIAEHYSGRPTGEESILARYCVQVAEAMQTGLFTYLAHPDLLHFVGDPLVYRRHIRWLCREAKSCGMALEMNMLGHWSGRHYPNPIFWDQAAEAGCDVIIGCDAHAPDHLLKTDAEEVLLDQIRQRGLHLVQTIPLRKIN